MFLLCPYYSQPTDIKNAVRIVLSPRIVFSPAAQVSSVSPSVQNDSSNFLLSSPRFPPDRRITSPSQTKTSATTTSTVSTSTAWMPSARSPFLAPFRPSHPRPRHTRHPGPILINFSSTSLLLLSLLVSAKQTNLSSSISTQPAPSPPFRMPSLPQSSAKFFRQSFSSSVQPVHNWRRCWERDIKLMSRYPYFTEWASFIVTYITFWSR